MDNLGDTGRSATRTRGPVGAVAPDIALRGYLAEVLGPQAPRPVLDEALSELGPIPDGRGIDADLAKRARDLALSRVARQTKAVPARVARLGRLRAGCAAVPALLAARASGYFSPADSAKLYRHLDRCPDCAALTTRFNNAEWQLLVHRPPNGLDRPPNGLAATGSIPAKWIRAGPNGPKPAAASAAPPAASSPKPVTTAAASAAASTQNPTKGLSARETVRRPVRPAVGPAARPPGRPRRARAAMALAGLVAVGVAVAAVAALTSGHGQKRGRNLGVIEPTMSQPTGPPGQASIASTAVVPRPTTTHRTARAAASTPAVVAPVTTASTTPAPTRVAPVTSPTPTPAPAPPPKAASPTPPVTLRSPTTSGTVSRPGGTILSPTAPPATTSPNPTTSTAPPIPTTITLPNASNTAPSGSPSATP